MMQSISGWHKTLKLAHPTLRSPYCMTFSQPPLSVEDIDEKQRIYTLCQNVLERHSESRDYAFFEDK